MRNFFIGLAGSVLIATSLSAASSNLVVKTAGVSANGSNAVASVEQQLEKLMENDDAAQAEVDKWIQENREFAAKGAGVPAAQLNQRIRERFDPIRKAYEEFIQTHPNYSKARVAYASFLGDIEDEEGAQLQLEAALKADTNNPAIYNNLANIYGHIGPVKKSFEYYAKAIALNPREPVYYHNFGTTVYLFRSDAKEVFGISDDQVYAKAFQLYSNAMRLDPQNFPLASDVAQTYYGIKPIRVEAALQAWTNAFNIARDDIEREGVHVHFARIKMGAGRLTEARAHLAVVTNEMYTDVKTRLMHNLEEQETKAKGTNAAPVAVPAS